MDGWMGFEMVVVVVVVEVLDGYYCVYSFRIAVRYPMLLLLYYGVDG
jgi:hypothetical protein